MYIINILRLFTLIIRIDKLPNKIKVTRYFVMLSHS